MSKYVHGIVVAGLGLFAFAACERSHSDTSSGPAPATTSNVELVAESSVVRTRMASLRERFTIKEPLLDADSAKASFTTRPLIQPGVAATFVAGERDIHPTFASEVRRQATRPATVLLPRTAAGATELRDDGSKIGVRFSLRGAKDVPVAVADGIALYAGALAEGDLAHRVNAEGTEDYAIFERKPAHEELTYDVDVSQAAGLRFVSNTLELLDEGGTPVVRVAPPYVVDREGGRHAAELAVVGCSYDRDPRGPWGRAVTAPGASSCQVSVRWHDVSYPAIVDPEWQTTGVMSLARVGHTATALPNGGALIVGATVAELYNPAGTGTFAVTDAPKANRYMHTATLLTDGKVLLVNGNNPLASADLYDPATGLFTKTGVPTYNSTEHVAVRLPSGKVLIAGGVSGGAETASASLFDPAAGSWAQVSPMNAARRGHTGTLINSNSIIIIGGGGSKVLIAGGSNSGTPSNLATAELFDPATNVFTFTANPMPAARTRHVAIAIPPTTVFGSDRVLIAGGLNPETQTFIYSGTTWSNGGVLTYPRESAAIARAPNGQIFVAGGNHPQAQLTTDLYPRTGTAVALLGSPPTSGQFNRARVYAELVTLTTGQMLIVGGQTQFPVVSHNTAERFWTAYGETCTTGADCVSGNCLDNRCCTGACSGTCMTCAAGTGACVQVTSAVDPDTCTGNNKCDAAGTCKLAEGQTCTLATDCASGNCVDGTCCNTACAGACDRCNLSGKVGTCSPAALGDPGVPACPTYACDGVGTSCGTGCDSDTGCAADSYCAPNGTCVPRKANAAKCDPSTECKSSPCRLCAAGACVDGVCCNTTCTGTCDACTAELKASGDKTGECGPQKDGANPIRGTCTQDPSTSCARDGKCSASGGCRLYYPAGQTCGASTCTGNAVTGFSCNGNGTCADNQVGVECAPFKCTGGTCTTSCTTNAECASDAWCNAGLCEKKRADGKACPNKDACANNICADGFCCNSPCTGQCEACDIKGSEGACAPITDKPHGARPACVGGESVCAAAVCDGTTRNTCAGFVGPSVTCGTAACTDGKATGTGTCSNGACQIAPPVPCGAYACGATACKTTCAESADCAPGNSCDPTTKKCISGATCDGDHTTTDVSGKKTECTPFKCESNGTCKPKCASVDDCVAPNACDPTGQCVPPPTGGDAAQDGCNATAMSSSSTSSFALVALVALGLLRRRRGQEATS